MNKEIAKVWTFQSESNPTKTYESLQYSDSSTSCGCPGWTRRVAPDGSRSCKHTRMIDQGIADSHCVSSHEYMEIKTMNKEIAKVWTFQSESNPTKTYESLQYSDSSTRCGCLGWTRRVAPDGSRSCKHTRMIDQGIADSHCVSSHEYGVQTKPVQHIQTTLKAKTAPTKLKTAPTRKIQWQ